MSIEMKIKAKTLAAEAQFIRREEQKLKRHARAMEARQLDGSGDVRLRYESLNDHRRKVVRPEARATHLARAFMKGVPYRTVEEKTRLPIKWALVGTIGRMVGTYGSMPPEGTQAIVDWMAVE